MWSLKPGCYKDRCVNEDGFHDQKYSLKKQKDVLRILAIGDSSTYGMGADFDFLYHTRLEKKLNQISENKVEVINTGVPGYSTQQGFTFYKERGRQYNPDIVTMYLGVNDTNKVFSRNDYQVMRSDLPTWINHTRILLSEFRIMKMIHKLVNKQNSDTSEPVVRVSQVRLKRNILSLKELVNRDGAKLIIISPPMKKLPRKDRRYQRIPIYRNIIEQTAKEQNIPIVVINELTERAQNNNDHLFASQFHPNEIGHKMIFKKLLEKVLALK